MTGERARPAPAGGELRAGRIVIRFAWRGDRFEHVVLRDGAAWRASVEGEGHDGWPESPPVQQLHFEERPAGRVALAVGQAGRSHWSVSFESDEAAGVVRVEAACRTGEAGSGRFVSTYDGPGGRQAFTAERSETAESGAAGRATTIVWRYVIGPGAEPTERE